LPSDLVKRSIKGGKGGRKKEGKLRPLFAVGWGKEKKKKKKEDSQASIRRDSKLALEALVGKGRSGRTAQPSILPISSLKGRERGEKRRGRGRKKSEMIT